MHKLLKQITCLDKPVSAILFQPVSIDRICEQVFDLANAQLRDSLVGPITV